MKEALAGVLQESDGCVREASRDEASQKSRRSVEEALPERRERSVEGA